jgi:hypothetical protein
VGLSDQVRLGAVTRWVTPELVAETLARCGVRDKKPGALPARFMVYFTLALALFQQDSYDDVSEHLVGGIPELGGSIPNKSSFTRARRRLGSRVLEAVFRKLAGPLAPADLAGSFYRGMLLAVVDGSCWTPRKRRRTGAGWRDEGRARAGRGVSPGEGGDADRDRDPCADRRGCGRVLLWGTGVGDPARPVSGRNW